jgi:transcriptional regulator with XRE-family HTH domain
MRLLTLGQRVREIRKYRRLESKELAAKAGLSPSEISQVESNKRGRYMDTVQKIAAALEVSSSYLVGELNAELPLEAALAKESLQIFLEEAKLGSQDERRLAAIASLGSAPRDVKGWRDLLANLEFDRSHGDSYASGL